MPGIPDLMVLNALIGQPGIYIERGHFHRGQLLSHRTEDAGYLAIRIKLDDEREHEFGSIHYDLQNGSLLASGYVSWAWIYERGLIDKIESRIAEEGANDDRGRCYRIARETIGRHHDLFCVIRSNSAQIPGRSEQEIRSDRIELQS